MNITLDDASPLFQFVSVNGNNSWITNHTAGLYVDSFTTSYFDSTFHGSFTQGDFMTLSFNGTAVYLYGAKRNNHGEYSVSMDGGTAATMLGFNATNNFQQLLYSQTGLDANTPHNLMLTALPNTTSLPGVNPINGLWWLDVDYAIITTSTTGEVYTTKFDDTSPYIQYTGNGWGTGPPFDPPAYFNTTAHIDTAAGSLNLKFNGSSVGLYGGMGANHGNYTVNLDGTNYGPYNGTWFNFAAQEPLFVASNLEDGPHLITLNNIGQNGVNNVFDLDFVIVNSTHNPSGAISAGNSTGTSTGSSTVPGAKKSSNTGAIVGGVVGGVAGLALIGFAVWWFFFRRRRPTKHADSQDSPLDLNENENDAGYYQSGYQPRPFPYSSVQGQDGSQRSPISGPPSEPASMSSPQMQQSFHNGEGLFLTGLPPPPASNATSYPMSINPPSTVADPNEYRDQPIPEGQSYRSPTAPSIETSAALPSSGAGSPAAGTGGSAVGHNPSAHKAATIALPFTAQRPAISSNTSGPNIADLTPVSPNSGNSGNSGSPDESSSRGRLIREGREVDAGPMALLEEEGPEIQGTLPPDYQQATQPLPGQAPPR